MNSRGSGNGASAWNKTPVPARVAERAFLRREVDEKGCWISLYSIASHGYAQIGWQDEGSRHVALAHRASWTYANGQVPVGMTLDHLCKNRRCVNPDHLRLLTNRENAQRNQGDDWPLGTCRNGHPDSARVPTKQGTRCGECHRLRQRLLRERIRNERHLR